jgi:TolB protein
MKTRIRFILFSFLICTILAACGPSPAELEATSTQFAADLFATQTAQAPTATATFTPSPTATATLLPSPTATNTPVPTFTPRPTRTPRSTPFGGGAQIAFSTNRDGNYEIYIMNSDGTNQRQLTDSPSSEDFFPELFPNGEVLLFWSYSAGPPTSSTLSWMTVDGSDQGTFLNNPGGVSDVSSHELVAFDIYTGDGWVDIGLVSSNGGKIVHLTNHPDKDGHPCWSPDGETIAFVSYRDGPPHIYLMDWDGGNQRKVTDSDLNELEPAWSPDGSTIAFLAADQSDTSNIYLVNADGTDIRPLTDEVGSYNENPVWSPDGTMIAFWSNRAGNKDIYAINVDGSGLINLTNDPGEDENPSWSK